MHARLVMGVENRVAVAGRLAVAALVVLVASPALAGCFDDDSSPKGVDIGDGTRVDIDAEPTEAGKGSIGGVVVDEAIRPIIGAAVTLTGADLNATTDDQGVFVFPDLEPGSYFLQAGAARFLDVQTAAEVIAGETTFVRILMAADPTPETYWTTYKHEGFMQTWGGIGQYFVEDIAPTGTCDCRMYFTPDPNVMTFVYEAFWKETAPDPADLAEFYYILREEAGGLDVEDYCFSPCYDAISGSDWSGGEVMARLDGPDTWTVFQQPFTLFVTTFHNGEAPEGWSIADDG